VYREISAYMLGIVGNRKVLCLEKSMVLSETLKLQWPIFMPPGIMFNHSPFYSQNAFILLSE